MKVLVLAGRRTQDYAQPPQELLEIWQDSDGRLHVARFDESRYEALRDEVINRLSERLKSAKPLFYAQSARTSREGNDETSTHFGIFAGRGDEDLVEVLKEDNTIWASLPPGGIGGYEVSTGYSYIEEREIPRTLARMQERQAKKPE